MLQTIREMTQGWIAGIIIGIIILSFALWGIHSYFEGGTGNRAVAEVNGVDITKEQLAVTYERLRRQTQGQLGAQQDDAGIKQRALQALIEREVLKQSSIAQGFKISSTQIDSYLQSMPEFQVDGQFSLERFQEVLSSSMLSTSEFLDLINASLLIDQPKLGVVFTSFAMPDEVDNTIAIVNQERDVSYLNIPTQMVMSSVAPISADKIQAYYDQHKNEFMTPEQVNVEYLELSLKDLISRIHPTEAQLKTFYNENINSYTQPTEWKLSDVLVPVSADASQEDLKTAKETADGLEKKLAAGADINVLARDYPGVLAAQEWVTLSRTPPELQKAVAALTKSNQLSSVVRTSKGFVIIKALDIKEPKIQSFETVKSKVSEIYARQQAEEKFAELREKLADLTYEHPDSLVFASKSLNLPVLSSELFSLDKGGKDISQYKKVRTTAFSQDVLNSQNNSEVIQINPEAVIVLRVKSHLASNLLPLKNIAHQIEEKLKSAEGELRAESLANDLLKKLQSGENPESLASASHLKWNKVNMIGRYSTKVDTAVLDLAFRLPNPAIQQNKPAYGVTKLTNGYAIVAVSLVKAGAVTDKKEYMVFAEQVQNSEGFLEYELYKQSQIANAKVKEIQS